LTASSTTSPIPHEIEAGGTRTQDGAGGPAEPCPRQAEPGQPDHRHQQQERHHLHARQRDGAKAPRSRNHDVHALGRGREQQQRAALHHRDQADRDQKTIDEIVPGEPKQCLIGHQPGHGGQRHREHHRDRKRQHHEIRKIPGRIGADHHKLTEREIHDTSNAERHRHAERDNSV